MNSNPSGAAVFEISWRLDLQIGLRAAAVGHGEIGASAGVCVCTYALREWGFCGLVALIILWFYNAML